MSADTAPRVGASIHLGDDDTEPAAGSGILTPPRQAPCAALRFGSYVTVFIQTPAQAEAIAAALGQLAADLAEAQADYRARTGQDCDICQTTGGCRCNQDNR